MDWEARITGDDTDLRTLAQAFTGPALSIIERDTEFFLGGTEFESLPNANAVRDKALEILVLITGAAKLRFGALKPLGVGHVVQLEGAMRHTTAFLEPAVILLRAPPFTVTDTRNDGTVEQHLPADLVVNDLLKSAQSAAVSKVLRLWSAAELVWTDLYRILEVIQADGPVSASKAEVKRFKHTADSESATGDLSRHGIERTDPPTNPMKFHEAREFIDKIIRNWLESKPSPQAKLLARSGAASGEAGCD